ncbi:meckelin [Oratosquilla oratoria]|uniref:meckelin n=1 Tax=Oratosquilla oratoria TaxID=337810 RepID=UPI003F76EC85
MGDCRIQTLLFVFSLFHIILARTFESVPFIQEDSCLENEIFDYVSLQCIPCSENQTRDEKDIYRCVCMPGMKTVHDSNGISCTACPSNQVPSQDKLTCIPCGEGLDYNPKTKQCDGCILWETNTTQIEETNILIDQFVNGTSFEHKVCDTCSSTSVPGADRTSCIPCHSSFYAAGKGTCSCPEKYVEYDGMCISQSELDQIPADQTSYTITYDNGFQLESLFFVENYVSSAYGCTFKKNKTACQILANMCTLLHYNFKEEASVCGYYRDEYGTNFIKLPDYVPWLYYMEGEAGIYLAKSRLKTQYTFYKNKGTSKLKFEVAKYSAHGKFLGSGLLEDEMIFCPDIRQHLSSAMQFGTTFVRSCRINVKDVWDKYETIFYDVFLEDRINEEEVQRYAVPVLNKNYKEDGDYFNRMDMKKWQLTRRLFLFDNLSGNEKLKPTATEGRSGAEVVRYVKHMEFVIRLREGEEAGLIYPPLIKVSYGELKGDDYASGKEIDITLEITYTMNFAQVQKDLSIAIGVMSALATLWSFIETWGWFRRTGKLGIDLRTIVHLLLIECGNLANIFFIVIFFSCFYWTVFFKRQDVIHVFLPSKEQEELLGKYITAAFYLKLFRVLYFIYLQVNIDMFIIDWEQPRARNSIPHPHKSRKGAQPESVESEQPISIWRTYFIANEWNEIQTLRRTNLPLQLLATLFFMEVAGFKNLASSDPYSNFHPSTLDYVPPQSFVCRFAISTVVYIIIFLVQWIFKALLYERYVENKLQQFVDLCSLANISIFILEYSVYGYYIHGRSVHGHADVNMQSFYEQLKREEEDLCGNRGLEPPSECQTFEVAVTQQFRDRYDNILKPITDMAGIDRPRSRGKMAVAEMERSVHAHESMKKFFSLFLQHALKGLDYIVKEKLFLESMLDIEFQEPEDKSLFFRDNIHSFDRVLLFGHEGCLVIFELLLIIYIDLLVSNFTLAAVVTFVASFLLKVVRNALGRKNVVRKTLVDQRFLV